MKVLFVTLLSVFIVGCSNIDNPVSNQGENGTQSLDGTMKTKSGVEDFPIIPTCPNCIN